MINFDIPFSVKSVKNYPYRTAQVTNRFFEIDASGSKRDAEGSMAYREFHSRLAKQAGLLMPDNHECYKVELQSGNIIYIVFSDWTIAFGLSIEERGW
jgi:hypothetical protein